MFKDKEAEKFETEKQRDRSSERQGQKDGDENNKQWPVLILP
jgi:hypothetical protein